MTKRLRLSSNNPTSIKFEKLCAAADELKISIEFGGHYVVIHDEERDEKLPPLYLEDIEEGHTVSNFPPCTEYKLVYTCPIAIAEEQAAHQKRMKEAADKLAADLAARAKEEETLRKREAKEKEQQERKTLATLKAKYPED